MPFSQSRRTRSLRLFKTMNKKSRPQPVVRKPVMSYRYEDESVGTFDMDASLSMCSSTHSRGMDDSWGLGGSSHSRSSHSRRCSFQPIDAASFEWELDLEDDGFLDLSIRSGRGIRTKRSSAKSNRKEDKTGTAALVNESVKVFFEDRVNTFTSNLEFLARKMTLC